VEARRHSHTTERSTKVRIEPESLKNRAIHPEQALRCEPTYPVAAISYKHVRRRLLEETTHLLGR
jgi:hypothetical protein